MDKTPEQLKAEQAARQQGTPQPSVPQPAPGFPGGTPQPGTSQFPKTPQQLAAEQAAKEAAARQGTQLAPGQPPKTDQQLSTEQANRTAPKTTEQANIDYDAAVREAIRTGSPQPVHPSKLPPDARGPIAVGSLSHADRIYIYKASQKHPGIEYEVLNGSRQQIADVITEVGGGRTGLVAKTIADLSAALVTPNVRVAVDAALAGKNKSMADNVGHSSTAQNPVDTSSTGKNKPIV